VPHLQLHRGVATTALCLALLSLTVIAPASAQSFGRNKVQYRQFDFQVLTTEHFRVYFYPEEADAARDMARMAERWYARLSRILQHDLSSPQPLVVYASATDFRQTNVLPGEISEGTGGVTEGFKRRIVMPAFGTLQETDHVLGHELVHAFQYDIAQAEDDGGLSSGFTRLPLWFVEGMAEYLSIGHVDAHTGMWIRDAIRDEGKLPSIGDLDNPKYFPYRWGQAFWAYVAGRWGDHMIRPMLNEGVRSGSATVAIEDVLSIKSKELEEAWHRAIAGQHAPVLAEGTRISTSARPLARDSKAERLAIAPSLSPDGRRVVYLSERDMLSVDMYVADSATGRILRRLTNTAVDPHFNSIQFLTSSGAWHPKGREFAFGAIRDGGPVLAVVDTENGRTVREIPFNDLGEILNPTWSPDGGAIAFSAVTAGRSDLFVFDVARGTRRQLTTDAFADLQPAWAPDGSRLAFVTDRFTTDLATLRAGRLELALIDVQSGRVEAVPTFERGKSINPQWAPNSRDIYFLSDATGTTNVYRVDVTSHGLRRLTNADAGVSGVTALGPALSMSADANLLAFTAYEEGRTGIYFVEGRADLDGVVVDSRISAEVPQGAVLPPATRSQGQVSALLADATTGLPETVGEAEPYVPRLTLDAVSRPYVSAGMGAFGPSYGGGIAFAFSDVLGNHNLYASIDANSYGGGVRDLYRNTGAYVAYLNRTHRWNWGVGGGQIPYLSGGYATTAGTFGGQTAIIEQEIIDRQVQRGADGQIAYPFSTARRIELGGGFQQVSFDRTVRSVAYSARTGAFLGTDTQTTSLGETLHVGTATAAHVYDTSVFGATSPVSGQRSRVAVTPAFGSLSFATATADYRRYFMPARFYTLAVRTMHYGRYGGDSESGLLYPLFLGYPELVRGYGFGSFRQSECQAGPSGSCEAFDQLLGSRMLVGNVELRFPLLRPFGAGSGMYGPVPIEVAFFADGGVAWTGDQAPSFAGGNRRPVSSAGVSLRMNLFGFTVAQADLAYPLQRPGRGWVFGFSLTPGF
jgi:Tol biopolymer transport system component